MKNKPAYKEKFQSHIYQLEQYIIRPTNCFKGFRAERKPYLYSFSFVGRSFVLLRTIFSS